MTTIEQFREKIQNLAMQANNLLEQKGDRVWTAEEQTQFDNWAGDIAQLKNQIKNIERMRELEADQFFNAAPGHRAPPADGISAMEAVALYMRHGSNVSQEQAVAIRNAMSTTTPSEGGYTVPAEIASMVIDKLKAFGGMRDVATIISTASGNAMNWPTSDGTAEVGAIVGQNAGAPGQDVAFGTVGLNVFYYTSKKIALPLELIQDSAVDVINFVIDRLATRIQRIQNAHYTVGAGTTEPDGIVGRSSAGKIGASGSTVTVAYDDLVELKHSVNRAYRAQAKFMINDSSVATLSKLKDTTGRPIWVPSLTADAPDTLLGHAVAVNDDMPVMAANAKSILFGDLSKYHIRDVAGTAALRRFDDSAFALNNQVGFCGWHRSGGNLLETAAVKYFQNSAT